MVEKLKSMGIEVEVPKPKKPPLKVKSTLLTKPYFLLVVTKCNLCNTVYEEGFEMRSCEYTNSLHSKKVELPLPTGFRTETRKVLKCRFCFNSLMNLSKEDLVKMVLKEIK